MAMTSTMLSTRRQAFSSAAFHLAIPASVFSVLGAACSRLTTGGGLNTAVWRLAAVSLALSVVLVVVNRYAAWTASELEIRIVQRILSWQGDLRDVFPRVERSIAERLADAQPAHLRETRNLL
jgi:hypothetical protein